MENNNSGWIKESLQSLVVAVIIALIIRTFIFQPFYIPSSSMEPTLVPGDRIIVSKLNYFFDAPNRGDVIVFRYPLDPSKDYVKRIVAMGGETVELRSNRVLINDKAIAQDYLPEDIRFGDFGPLEVPEGSYFVLGDNRNNSQDSRYWGTLDKDYLIGEAVLIFWPLTRSGIID